VIIAVFVYFKFFRNALNLPNRWFWDHMRILSSDYSASLTKPIIYYQEVKPKSKTREENYLNQLKEKLDFKSLKIDKVYALVAPNLAMAVNCHRKVQTSRMRSNPAQFFSQSWKSFPDFEMRLKVMNWFQEKVSSWDWNKGLTLDQSPVLWAVHGTNKPIAWKIAEAGFAALSTLDKGFYGKGIYFSTSARYIMPYYADKKHPTILICLIIPGNVYPVIELMKGQSLKRGYQSHYCVTKHGGMPFTKKDYKKERTRYDELVLGQEPQVVPLFLLEMNKEHCLQKYKKWKSGKTVE